MSKYVQVNVWYVESCPFLFTLSHYYYYDRHNIGLSHSGESGAGYGDGSCYMGYGGGDVKVTTILLVLALRGIF